MSVHIYATDRQTGRHHLIHEFGPHTRGAQQLGGDFVVLPEHGYVPLLRLAEGEWDLALVTDEHGHTHIEVPRPSTQAEDTGRSVAPSAPAWRDLASG